MVKQKSLQIYLAIYLAFNLIIHQVNILDTYIKSLLDINEYLIFLKLPSDMHKFCYSIQKSLLYRLLQSLYRLKQSGQLWNKNVIAFYKSIDFRQLNSDPSIFIRQTEKETSAVNMYIDDFLLASNTIDVLQVLKNKLGTKYKIKNLSKAKTIIGWQITRDTSLHMMKINQSAFIRNRVINEELTNYNTNVILIKSRISNQDA